MKIPLIADASHKTVNKQTGVQNVIIWSRGDKLVVKSPRQHGYYLEGGDTERQVLGKTKKKNYKFYPVENIGELSVEKISPNAKLDGVSRNEIERICIEHPEYFSKFTSPKIKTMCFDIETYSDDSTFPFGEKYPVVSIGVKTDDGKHKVFFWDEDCNDKPCIQGFLDYIKEYDPDIIYGYNNIAYDIPQIEFRAKFHGIDIRPYFNREFRKTDLDQQLGLKKNTMRCWGRIIADVMNFTRRDYALSGMEKSLKSVAKFYGQDPLELDWAGKSLLDYTYEEIYDYVVSDVDVTKHLFDHYFPQQKFIAELLKVPLESLLNGSDAFMTKILQGRSLHSQGILTFDKNKDRHPDTSYQAAHIDLYKPGFHKANYKVDFKSMYPSIAMALNLGPDTTRIKGYEDYDVKKFGCRKGHLIHEDVMELVIPDKVIEKNVIIEVDQSKKSGLYTMCKQFKEMREPYKRQNTHEAKSASNALKIMVNTFYGANTNPYMSYGDLAVGIAITGVARWLIMGARKIIEMSAGDVVVYIHTDGVNTNADVDLDFVNHNLQKATKEVFPLAEPEWVEVEKDVFKEGFWVQIGNYVLRKEDGSLVKHGSTFKSKSRSRFYRIVLDKIIDARIDNKVTPEFIKDLYKFDNYILEDFVQMRTMNREINEYKTENDLVMQLAREAQKIGMNLAPGTQFSFYKTNEGYKLVEQVMHLDEIDIKYHWDVINNLLKKFGLVQYVKKNPPLTVKDRKQRMLLDFI
jgi:DNA polymerase I